MKPFFGFIYIFGCGLPQSCLPISSRYLLVWIELAVADGANGLVTYLNTLSCNLKNIGLTRTFDKEIFGISWACVKNIPLANSINQSSLNLIPQVNGSHQRHRT